jgi:hypothetical protein
MSTAPAPQLNQAQVNYSETDQWKQIIKQALMYCRCAVPAIVQSVDYTKNPPVVTVQVALSELVIVPAPPGPHWEAIKPIANVPICLPRAGGFLLTLPVQKGDEGLLVFCDACIDLWWTKGGVQPPDGTTELIQPNHEQRRHDLTDCGFYPGMSSQARPITAWSQNSAQLRSEDDTIIVDVAKAGITLMAPKVVISSSGDVDITASGTVNINGKQIVAASSQDNTEIDGQIFLTHEHTDVQAGTDQTGPVYTP